MKKSLLILFLLIDFLVYSQTSIGWGSAQIVASGYSNVYPRLSLLTNDLPLVVWESASADKVYTSKWNGSAFTTPVAVNPAGVVPFIANWSGAEVASSGDTAFIVFFSEPVMSAKIYMVRSIDGGLSFGDTMRIDLWGTNNIPAFPGVAVAPGGNPVVHYMLTDSLMMDAEYVVRHSADGGNNFSTPVVPSLGATGFVCDCCPASMAIAGNKQILMYRNDDSNIRDIWASFSSDGSTSFPASTEIDQTGWYIASCPSSGPSGIISGDSLYYTWMSDATTDARIYVGSVNINDQQVGVNRQVYPFGTATQNYPVMAGNGDTIGLVWQGHHSGLQEVLFTYSVTGLSGLGEHVDTLTKAFSGHQSRPDIVFANGKFHIVYSDSNGSNVKYLTGSISTIMGLSETADVPFTFTSVYENGNVLLRINSKEQFNSICNVYNSSGQKILSSSPEVPKGRSESAISVQLKQGIYLVELSDHKGRSVKTKIRVIR
jgi:hypothetical protein